MNKETRESIKYNINNLKRLIMFKKQTESRTKISFGENSNPLWNMLIQGCVVVFNLIFMLSILDTIGVFYGVILFIGLLFISFFICSYKHLLLLALDENPRLLIIFMISIFSISCVLCSNFELDFYAIISLIFNTLFIVLLSIKIYYLLEIYKIKKEIKTYFAKDKNKNEGIEIINKYSNSYDSLSEIFMLYKEGYIKQESVQFLVFEIPFENRERIIGIIKKQNESVLDFYESKKNNENILMDYMLKDSKYYLMLFLFLDDENISYSKDEIENIFKNSFLNSAENSSNKEIENIIFNMKIDLEKIIRKNKLSNSLEQKNELLIKVRKKV